MLTKPELEEMRKKAYTEAGYDEHGDRPWPDIEDDAAEDYERRRAYAEGVEAALLWVLGDAGKPF